jgi:hypothetical protein
MEKLTRIKVSKEVANSIFVYCKMNNLQMSDFVSKILGEKFKDFKNKVKELSDFKVEL